MAKEWARAFYKSKAWQDVRAYVLKRDRYMCVRCGAPGEEVHHIIHLTKENIWNTAISLDASNLELLCGNCHKAEHTRDRADGHTINKDKREIIKQIESSYVFDDNGNIVPRA